MMLLTPINNHYILRLSIFIYYTDKIYSSRSMVESDEISDILNMFIMAYKDAFIVHLHFTFHEEVKQ